MSTTRTMSWPGAVSTPANGPTEPPDIETSSETYARRFRGPVGAWLLRVQEQAVLQMLSAMPHSAVLEVGGGHGQLTAALIRQGHRVTVVGSSPSCQERIKPLLDAGLCRFSTVDLLNLPYPDGAFDAVISVRLLAHLESWRRVIAELARVAHHGVIVDYPTFRSWNCLTPLLFYVKRWFEKSTRPYRVFHEAAIVEAFAAHGLAYQHRSPQLFFPIVLHRVLGQADVSASLEAVCRKVGLTEALGSPVIAMFTRLETP